MTILDTIIEVKHQEVAQGKKKFPPGYWQDQPFYTRQCISLVQRLREPSASGIIAEFKRKSPSKGFIHEHADVVNVTNAYTSNGASGLSILTDEQFFGGSTADLTAARNLDIPILRKDFIIDTYQVDEAKAIGADLILLIAACLQKYQVEELAAYAHTLGLEVLLELHDESELDHVCSTVDLVGINNRNLKDFTVDIDRSLRMAKVLGHDRPLIAESGIDDPSQVRLFREAGFEGFLIGEQFMKSPDPGKALHTFVANLNFPV